MQRRIAMNPWWDQLGVIYWELLKPNETITADVYRRQFEAMHKERSIFHERHDKIILHHDNARPHVASVVKTYL